MDRAARVTSGRFILVAPIIFGLAVFAALAGGSSTQERAAAHRMEAAPAPLPDSLASPAPDGQVAANPAGTAGGGGAGGQVTPPAAAAAPASDQPDQTLPAHPALQSFEARAQYERDQAMALRQLAAVQKLGPPAANGAAPAASGHAGTNPELLPDLRPLNRPRQGEPSPDKLPGKPFFNPDLLGPLFDNVAGPFRPQLPQRDASNDPTPNYSEAERKQLIAEGKDLFFSTTAFGQRPSQGPLVAGEFLSCASCHSGRGFSDARTHLIGPVREREFGHRQTPSLFAMANTAPFGWDGRNPQLQNQARGAIVAPLEMNASREPTKRELDGLAFFQETLRPDPAVPGIDFDPVRARLGKTLFETPRQVIDPSGEFGSGDRVSCSTCHAGPFRTDGKAHRIALPTFYTGDFLFDPGEVDKDGNIRGFHTPSLIGVRFTSPFFHDGVAGDPTAPSNLLGGGLGARALDGDVGASGPPAARRALLDNVLPFYNSIRFNFGFTQEELKNLAEFVLSL
jgi:cytochrome c peroxidase